MPLNREIIIGMVVIIVVVVVISVGIILIVVGVIVKPHGLVVVWKRDNTQNTISGDIFVVLCICFSSWYNQLTPLNALRVKTLVCFDLIKG